MAITPQTSTGEIPSVRARKACNRLGIYTLEQLATWNLADLTSSWAGRDLQTVDIVTMQQCLALVGLSFRYT